MLKEKRIPFWLPIVLFLIMLVDGQFTRLFGSINENQSFMHFHLLLLIMIVFLPLYKRRDAVLTAFFLGLIYDFYYLGIVGIWSLCLPVFVSLQYVIFEQVETTPFTILLSFILSVTLIESISFLMQVIFQLITGKFIFFITGVLGPTILLNVVLFIFFIFPLLKIFRRSKK